MYTSWLLMQYDSENDMFSLADVCWSIERTLKELDGVVLQDAMDISGSKAPFEIAAQFAPTLQLKLKEDDCYALSSLKTLLNAHVTPPIQTNTLQLNALFNHGLCLS